MDKDKEQIITPGLYLVSTPIGNMDDITLRALTILKKSNIILCEDTRRSGKLLSYFQIKNKLMPYHKFNEKKVSNKIIDSIKKNKVISLISDAGTPAISDPGKILINKCIEENLSIHPIPGPSAVTSAVSVSGFGDQYLFYGFLPKKGNKLESELKNLCNCDYAVTFFIPASKINFYISRFKKYFFNRKIVIAKEMTKIHEKFIRNNVESIKDIPEILKGELTVVLSKKIKEKNIKKEISESVKIEINKMLKKYSHKDVVEFICKKEKELEKVLKSLCNIDYSIVFFVPASKINFYIDHFKKYFLDRKIVIAKEMTKIHEEFIRDRLELIKRFPESLKGELTIVLSEKIKGKKIKKEISESVKIEIKKMLKKYSHKDVVEFISKKENLAKKLVYDFCLKLKK